VEVRVVHEGLDGAAERLRGVSRRLSGHALWDALIPVIQDENNHYLSTEGLGTFPPLAASTLKKKRRSPRPYDTISRATWTSLVWRGPYTLISLTPFRLEIGVSHGPAHWHQVPRRHGDKVTPARPALKITPRLLAAVRRAARAVMRQQIGAEQGGRANG